jgi:hypothetical protein
MIEYKKLLIGACFFLFAQSLSWYQTNGQFISTWVKEHPILMSALTGIPVGLGYIYGTAYIVEAFGGKSLWASRLIGFATGVFTFSILTYLNVKEGITLKTGVILALATTIVLLQVFWITETDD